VITFVNRNLEPMRGYHQFMRALPEILQRRPQARVVIVEPMGSETQVMMKIGETAVNGVFRERITARPGDILPVAPQAAMAHLFNKATGERL
jgi:hypothetical protein